MKHVTRDDLVNNPNLAKHIQYSKPRVDCEFCRVYNFMNSYNQFYAQCVYPDICRGLCAVDISAIPEFGLTVNCRLCRRHSSSLQLVINFD